MTLMKLPKQIEARLPNSVPEVHWTRVVGAGSLIVSAWLLLTGRRKAALAVAAGGAAVTLLENPEVAQELWKGMPGYLHSAKDMLVRVEEFVEDIAEKGNKLRKTLTDS
jgi:hypothetical protein